jgi:site-specific DNA recombinase
MRCGLCGGGCCKTGAQHFGCSTARNKGPTVCANRPTVRQERLEAWVLSGLRERLMDPDLFQIFAKEFTAEWNRLQSAATGERDQWLAERKRLSSQIDRLVDAVADGKAIASLTGRLAALEQARLELDRKLVQAPAIAPRLHPSLPTIYRQKIRDPFSAGGRRTQD